MNMKKVLAGALASVMAVSTMAVCASAADVTVDASKLIWGDIEGNGNLRLDIFNVFGPTSVNQKYDATVSPINPADVTGGNLISVTLTIAGLPEDMKTHKAAIFFAPNGWSHGKQFEITGNGTYTIEYFTSAEDIIDHAEVFVIDFLKMADSIGLSKSALGEDADAVEEAMKKITISDVKISVTTADGYTKNDGSSNEGTATEDTSKDPAGTTQTPPTGDKNQPNTGVEGVAVVAGLAVLAAGAIVIAKKRK